LDVALAAPLPQVMQIRTGVRFTDTMFNQYKDLFFGNPFPIAQIIRGARTLKNAQDQNGQNQNEAGDQYQKHQYDFENDVTIAKGFFAIRAVGHTAMVGTIDGRKGEVDDELQKAPVYRTRSFGVVQVKTDTGRNGGVVMPSGQTVAQLVERQKHLHKPTVANDNFVVSGRRA